MDITVILCTFNRCQLLRTALESVAASIMPDGIGWEVLVVDNNSSDGTREVATEFSCTFPGRFRYLFESNPGKSYALNAGIAESAGEILAFMDDDVTVAPEWLQSLTSPLRKANCEGVGGRVFPRWTTDPPAWLGKESWMATGPLVYFDRGDEGYELRESPVGTNMAFKKKLFEQYGTFRVDLGPSPNNEIRNEDSEFARRILSGGERLRYEPSAVVYHYVAPERLRKSYFLKWWFDKGRTEIRELGVPETSRWQARGVPLYLIRRLAKWSAKWAIAVGSEARFECKLSVWLLLGQITESYRGTHVRTELSQSNSPVGRHTAAERR